MNRRLGILLVAGAGLVSGLAALALSLGTRHEEVRVVGHPAVPAFVLLIGWSFIGSGLVGWWRRPSSRFGVLLAAAGFAWFAAGLTAANTPVWFTIGLLITPIWIAVFFHALLSFPSGRLELAAARVVVGLFYLEVTVVQLAWFLFADLPQLLGCSTCPENVFLVADRPQVANAVLLVQQPIIAVLLLVGGIGVMAYRWRVATPPLRRSLAPVYLSGAVCILILALTIGVDPFFPGLGEVVSWAGGVAFTAVPLAFLFGLLRQRLGQSAVGELVVQLGATPAGPELRGALRRALRDPSLEVAYWLPDSGSYVDAAGRPFVLPSEGARVATTTVEHGGQRVAALVHDPSLRDDPDLVRAVCAAAGLALSNARLQAELRARLEELRESRSRIVAAGDAERRRLERNLHDGAQQRLLSVALGLRLAQARLAGHPEEAELLARSRRELEQSLQELRELAHGLHPAVLSDHGLAVALEAVAARSPVPVKLFVDLDGRLPDTVEAAAYYLVTEALANVAKHAQASKATVQVARQAGWVLVEVRDDGIGSADPSGPGGLRGLADRIAALDGRLEIRSPQGAGTTVRAEIPCA